MIYELIYGEGVMTCPLCWGRGHLIGVATTTAAECWTCLGNGKVSYRQVPTALDAPLSSHKRGEEP